MLKYITVQGKRFPATFSLGASRELADKFGGLSKIEKVLNGKEITGEMIDGLVSIIHACIVQGVTYANAFEPNADGEKIDGQFYALPKEVLEAAIGINDFETITAELREVIDTSSKTTIKTKAGKNE